jgi:hypothetical protein
MKMARLNTLPRDGLIKDLPTTDKLKLALEWLRANPTEKPTTAARAHCIENVQTVQQVWRRERKRVYRTGTFERGRPGAPTILTDTQHQALIQYAIDQATNGGIGATKRIMWNAICYLRKQAGQENPCETWFTKWLKETPELYIIKTKPIPRHRTDMHTPLDLRKWFDDEYAVALKETGIADLPRHEAARYIHNMDEKGCRLACPPGEEIVVPLEIAEMYIGIPENRLSLTVIESICADGIAIPPVVIIPGGSIMEH